ncbi:MAG: tRNA lysidine(34) synthetase TilS, partial [Bacteroidota bacterium]
MNENRENLSLKVIQKRFTTFSAQEDIQEGSVLLAFSAGVDSVVLGELLALTKREFAVVHCNFQLRGKDSEDDALFAKRWAVKKGIPFFSKTFDTRQLAQGAQESIQMLARRLRYDFFEEVALREGFDFIATAHHQNDVLETLLLNLTKGTGIAGLHGILPKSGKLIRPLLCLSKVEILDFAQQQGLEWREDASNQENYYLRNRLRNVIIPELKEINPSLEKTAIRNVTRFRGTELLQERALKDLREYLIQKESTDELLDAARLFADAPEPEVRIVFLENWLRGKGFVFEVIEKLARILDFPVGKQFLGQKYTLIIERNGWRLKPVHNLPKVATEIYPETESITFRNQEFLFQQQAKKADLPFREGVLYFDADKLDFPLRIRTWRVGDRFSPLGMKGKTQKVSDVLTNQKVPIGLRHDFLVITDSEGQVIGILGLRSDERYKITSLTEKVFSVESA